METEQKLAQQIAHMHDHALSNEKAREAARNLTGFFELLMQISLENKEMKHPPCR